MVGRCLGHRRLGVSTFFLEWDDPVLPLPGGVALEARHFEGWARWSGTSFATPAVAGAIAALAERDGVDVRGAAFRLLPAAGAPPVPAIKGGGTLGGWVLTQHDNSVIHFPRPQDPS